MEFGCGFGFGVRFVIVCFAMVGWFGWLFVVSVGLRYRFLPSDLVFLFGVFVGFRVLWVCVGGDGFGCLCA